MEPQELFQFSAANSLPTSGKSQDNPLTTTSDSLQLPNTSSTQSGSSSNPMEAQITEEAMEVIDYSQSLHDKVLDVFAGMTEVATKIVDSNQSLHDEVLDVFTGITEVTGEIVDYNQSLLENVGEFTPGDDPSLNPILASAITKAQEHLETFTTDKEFLDEMNLAFGEDLPLQEARGLIQDLASGDLPDIEVLPAVELKGAAGAYGKETQTIYLSQDLLSENASEPEVVADVLLEEIGHYVDQELGGGESRGDEGDIFSRLVQGETLSAEEIERIKQENDKGTISLPGDKEPVEEADPAYPGYNLIFDPEAPEYDEDPEVVKQWQQAMLDQGYEITVDGDYGEKSVEVAKQFQADQGLEVDGIVGEETWAATFSTDVVQPPDDIEYGDYDPVGGAPEFVTEEFLGRVFDISQGLDVVPEYLMAVMGFETGGSYDPAIQNADSGATGLIQFLESTAENLGTTTDELAGLTAVEQLDYVEQYFSGFRGSLSSLDDTYLAVLYPTAIGEDVVFEEGTEEYDANAGLDENGDGVVTAEETTASVREFLPGETLFAEYRA